MNANRTLPPAAAPTLIVGPDGLIREANEAANGMLGYSGRALVGLSLAWISPPSRHSMLQYVDAALAQQELQWGAGALLHADGHVVEVHLTFQPGFVCDGAAVAISIEHAVSEQDEEPAPRGIALRNLPTCPAPSITASTPVGAPTPLPRPGAPLRTLLPPAHAHHAKSRKARQSSVGTIGATSHKLCERLRICVDLLAWLEAPVANARGDVNARARIVLEELSTVLEECRREISGHDLLPKRAAVSGETRPLQTLRVPDSAGAVVARLPHIAPRNQ